MQLFVSSFNQDQKSISRQGLVYVLLCAGLFFTSLAYAVGPNPNPELNTYGGQILQQIERDLEAKPIETLPQIEAKPIDASEDQGPKVTVKQFKFVGNKVVTSAQLESIVESLLNRSISVPELKTSLDLISNYYREQGYLATATLPEQDITEGTVTINIVEALFGAVKIDGQYGKDFNRVRPSVVERFITAKAPKGKALDQNQLNNSLMLIKELAGFDVSANYQAGEVDNSTDLLVKIKDRKMISASLSADNTGGRFTGRDKQTAFISFASPLGLGDDLNLTYQQSRGTDYGRLAYKLPVGAHGVKVGANASFLEYEFVTKMSADSTSQPVGHSSTKGIDISYPLWLSRTSKVNVELNYDEKSFKNFLLAPERELKNDYNVNIVSLVLSASHYDGFLAGAQNAASLDFGSGKVNMTGSTEDHRADDLSGQNTQGRFKRLKWNLSRNQFLTDTWALNFDATGQFANRNLDSSEKLYLGGINGIRAYPTSEGSGSDGYIMKLELRKFLPYNFNASVFMDHGRIQQYHDDKNLEGEPLIQEPIGAGENAIPNRYILNGYGATLAWNGPYNSTIKATYATRIKDNPNPATDKVSDQDGSLRRHVLWLSGSIAF